MYLYVGVDWGAKSCVIVAGADDQEWRTKCEPSVAAVGAVVAKIRARFAVQEVRVGIEDGAPLWIRLFHSAGAIVHVVDPKQAKRYAESLSSSGAKDDCRDARMLRDLISSPRHCPAPWTPDSEATQLLGRLSSHRERLVEDRVREVQRLRDELRRSMPLVDDSIKSFESKWARRLVRRAPTAWHLARLAATEVEQLLAGARAATVDAVQDAIRRTQAPWLTEAMAKVSARYVRGALVRLRQLDKDIAALDVAIDEVLDTTAEAQQISAVKGLGRQLTTALLVFGLVVTDPSGHRDAVSVRMGSSPVFIGSATHANGQPKGVTIVRRSANPTARQSTYLIGRLLVMHHPWAAGQYRAAKARGKKAATAYRQVTRSFLRILHAMMRDGTDYDEAKYENTLLARGVTRSAA